MLKLEERNWIRRAMALGRGACVEDGVALLASCPESFRSSPDYGVYAGIYLGRVLTVVSRGRGGIPGDVMDLLYASIDGWTMWPPESMAALIERCGPRLLLALLFAWPRPARSRRPFFVGVYLGMFIEGHEETEDLSDRKLDALVAVLGAHRRPDADGDSLI